jgi:hypothetical protein
LASPLFFHQGTAAAKLLALSLPPPKAVWATAARVPAYLKPNNMNMFKNYLDALAVSLHN